MLSAMASPRTLGLEERRTVALWAADCAEAVLPIFARAEPNDRRPREAIDGLRAFARGEVGVGRARALAQAAHAAAREVPDAAATAAARSAGQAVSCAHMAAHALGAAVYAALAVGLTVDDDAEAADAAVARSIDRQVSALSPSCRRILQQLPNVVTAEGETPRRRNLVGRGALVAITTRLQAAIAEPEGR